MLTARFRPTLETLTAIGVEFIVVGGIAAVFQGAPIVTFDLGIVPLRTPENVARLLDALTALSARYRHDPRELVPSAAHLLGPGHNLLATTMGDLDVLGTIANGLSYEDLVPDTEQVRLSPTTVVRVLSLRRLIEVKEATGRAKDLAVLPTLRATLAETRQRR